MKTRKRHVQTQCCAWRSFAVVALAGSLLLAGCDGAGRRLEERRRNSALTSLAASFDWSMPDRLRVDESNTIQLVDPNPPNWPVNFDACASSPRSDITEYRWTFGDGHQAVATRCDGLSHAFPSEGLYTVSLTVASADGSTATTTSDVNVQDFLIVALGDSYGAGEGSPNVEVPESSLQRWVELGQLIAQAGLDFNHASAILGAIDRVAGPLENLLTAITFRDALDCVLCTPDGIGEGLCFAGCLPVPGCAPVVCFVCKDDCRNAADKVAKAAEKLATALADAATVQGLEFLQSFIDDPTGLKREIEGLRAVWNAALAASEAAIQTFEGERDAIPHSAAAKWDDRQCHRSSFSAQARTALAIEAADPKSSVTFIHLACSGAKTTDLYEDGYEGIESSAGGPLPAQLKAAAEKVGDREVDAILLSIGGNDANFAPIIFAGISQEPTHEPQSPLFRRVDEAQLGVVGFCALTYFFSGKCFDYFGKGIEIGLGPPGLQLYQEGVARLPQAYATLNDHVRDTFAHIAREPNRVLIAEYPDATQDEEGRSCSPRLDRLPDLLDIPGWSMPEWIWVGETVIPGINGTLHAAAESNRWTPVGGIHAGFARHGLCSDQNWINRIQQSFTHQGDSSGSAHPNRAGYAEVAIHEIAALRAQLFSGPGETARAPQVHPVADAGPAIVVDEGNSLPLINNSLDPSRTGHLMFQWSLAASPAGGALLSSTVAPTPTLFALDDTVGIVNVEVHNDFGSGFASANLVVRNVAPTVTSGGDRETVEGTPITLTASFVDPGVLDTHTAAIDWGDGTFTNISLPMGARTLSAEHRYLNQGNFTALVLVRDDDGGEGSTAAQATVSNLPPVLGPLTTPFKHVRAGTEATVSASFSDPGVLDVHTGTVSWGDGTASPATIVESGGTGIASGTHSYTRPGSYGVTMVVTDDDSGSATASNFIKVTGPPVR